MSLKIESDIGSLKKVALFRPVEVQVAIHTLFAKVKALATKIEEVRAGRGSLQFSQINARLTYSSIGTQEESALKTQLSVASKVFICALFDKIAGSTDVFAAEQFLLTWVKEGELLSEKLQQILNSSLEYSSKVEKTLALFRDLSIYQGDDIRTAIQEFNKKVEAVAADVVKVKAGNGSLQFKEAQLDYSAKGSQEAKDLIAQLCIARRLFIDDLFATVTDEEHREAVEEAKEFLCEVAEGEEFVSKDLGLFLDEVLLQTNSSLVIKKKAVLEALQAIGSPGIRLKGLAREVTISNLHISAESGNSSSHSATSSLSSSNHSATSRSPRQALSRSDHSGASRSPGIFSKISSHRRILSTGRLSSLSFSSSAPNSPLQSPRELDEEDREVIPRTPRAFFAIVVQINPEYWQQTQEDFEAKAEKLESKEEFLQLFRQYLILSFNPEDQPKIEEDPFMEEFIECLEKRLQRLPEISAAALKTLAEDVLKEMASYGQEDQSVHKQALQGLIKKNPKLWVEGVKKGREILASSEDEDDVTQLFINCLEPLEDAAIAHKDEVRIDIDAVRVNKYLFERFKALPNQEDIPLVRELIETVFSEVEEMLPSDNAEIIPLHKVREVEREKQVQIELNEVEEELERVNRELRELNSEQPVAAPPALQSAAAEPATVFPAQPTVTEPSPAAPALQPVVAEPSPAAPALQSVAEEPSPAVPALQPVVAEPSPIVPPPQLVLAESSSAAPAPQSVAESYLTTATVLLVQPIVAEPTPVAPGEPVAVEPSLIVPSAQPTVADPAPAAQGEPVAAKPVKPVEPEPWYVRVKNWFIGLCDQIIDFIKNIVSKGSLPKSP